MKISDLVKHLKTLPQDYEVWSNDGYYNYSDYPCGDVGSLRIEVSEKDKRVTIGESL